MKLKWAAIVFLSVVFQLLGYKTLAFEATETPSKYFVIQNLATEKTRVYERCTATPRCPHRLVFEAENVIGKPEEGTPENPEAFKTLVGHAKIAGWMKFYQDYKKHYPHWYKAGQDLASLPPPAPRDAAGNPEKSLFWGKKWLVQQHGETTMRGAFGWYAAILTPEKEVDYQWMHGTIGWGMDGDVAIQLTRSTLINIFSNPGSSGCTRLSNASISYLRHLLPVGTDIYRIYAHESTRVPTCLKYNMFWSCVRPNVDPRYVNQTKPFSWDYIMLTDGAQKMGGLEADARTIEAKKIPVVPGVNLIERGTVFFDQYPTPVAPDYRWVASSGKSGDRYEIDEPTGAYPTNFRGYFLVDEGRLIDYQHPVDIFGKNNIKAGGLDDFKTEVPEVLKTSGKHYPPRITYKAKENS